jgi:hypothetical protein
VINGGYLRATNDAFIARLQAGTKFDVMAFLNLFDIPNAYHHARIVVSKIDL